MKAGTTTYAAGATGSPVGQKASSTVSYYLRDPHGDTVGLVSVAAANQAAPRSIPTAGCSGFPAPSPCSGGALKGRAERALAQACRFDLLGVSLCQKRSFGIGQVQIRRAMLVDPAVRRTFGFGSDGCRPGGTTCWDPSPGGIAQRLQDDELAIHYTVAHLGLLRYGHPAGASWEAIYGVPTPIGEFKVDFVESFAEARHYYSYLDR